MTASLAGGYRSTIIKFVRATERMLARFRWSSKLLGTFYDEVIVVRPRGSFVKYHVVNYRKSCAVFERCDTPRAVRVSSVQRGETNPSESGAGRPRRRDTDCGRAGVGGVDCGWFARVGATPIYSEFAYFTLVELGAQFSHAQAHISTEPASPQQSARLPGTHEDQERPRGTFASSRQGTQARLGFAGLSRLNVAADFHGTAPSRAFRA